MSSNVLGRALCFLSVRNYLMTLPSKELINLIYLGEDGKQDTECIYSFLNTISFLLYNEKYYPFLGKDVVNNIYDVLSYGRNIITEDREKICGFINNLIVRLNSICSNNYEEERKKYLSNELYIRTGESGNDYAESFDIIEAILKEYMKYDLAIFESIFGSSDKFIVNDSNIKFLISSFSYYSTYLSYILDDEEILKIVAYIKYVLDYANHRQFSEKYISKSVFEKHKKVLKRIQNVIDKHMDKTNISDKDINKLKVKAKTSIN